MCVLCGLNYVVVKGFSFCTASQVGVFCADAALSSDLVTFLNFDNGNKKEHKVVDHEYIYY